ncbi:MAG: hypothetical protein R3335_00245 [Anaerolineales bacterium]|nr:hypothetical protein [Anaerolineales bacterium]
MEEEITPVQPEEESGGNRTFVFLGIFIVAALLLLCCCLTIALAWFFGDLVLSGLGIPIT